MTNKINSITEICNIIWQFLYIIYSEIKTSKNKFISIY
jgi:hypothetical protein